MNKPYDFLDGILNEIEKGLKTGINTETLADNFTISQTHLRRIFKFAFGLSIGTYIRSRKLTASLEDLLKSNFNILDIAMEYGLGYEQSYIRTFKREFGLTPGELRKTCQVVKIKPPLQLFSSNRLSDSLIFGPEIVMVPQFHVVGRRHLISLNDASTLVPNAIHQFYTNERKIIPDTINPDILFNISTSPGSDTDQGFILPSVQVKLSDDVPAGFCSYTFPSSLCARFRFIGSDDSVLAMTIADEMFKAIDDFIADEHQNYFLERRRITIDRFDTSDNNKLFKLWDWFSPVIEKKEKIKNN
jgi:AraC family transcriptional regulator